MEKRIIIDLFDKVNLETYVASVDIPNLRLLKAGRFDEDYPVRVNTFSSDNFYDRKPKQNFLISNHNR